MKVYSAFADEGIGTALERMESRAVFGKIVLRVS